MEKTIRNGEKGRIVWIELLRIVSIFAVVLLHMASLEVKNADLLYTGSFNWLSIYFSVTRFGVCCFVMISGALFLNPDRPCTIKGMAVKQTGKIVILYGFWSFLYSLLYMIRLWMIGQELSWSVWLERFLYGHYHLWFLLMVAGLYLLTPILHGAVKNRKHMEYLLFLCAVFYFLPNMLKIFPEIYEGLKTLTMTKMNFYPVMGYLGYYVLGNYLNTREFSAKERGMIYVLGLAGMVYGVCVGIDYSRRAGKISQYPYDNLTLNMGFYSAAVFLFFRYELGRLKALEKAGKWICRAGGCTLGIYVIHAMLIDTVGRKLYGLFGVAQAWLLVPAGATLIFVLSFAAAACLKKIPGINRWLI